MQSQTTTKPNLSRQRQLVIAHSHKLQDSPRAVLHSGTYQTYHFRIAFIDVSAEEIICRTDWSDINHMPAFCRDFIIDPDEREPLHRIAAHACRELNIPEPQA